MKSLFNFKGHFQAFGEVVSILTRHKQLTWEMSKRDISDRYAGQVLGTLWAVGHPMILMGIYVFIFACVFRMKIGGTKEMPLNYTVYLLSGLIPWMSFQESMSKGATAITGNANLVKQVVFPIEILPVKVVVSSFLTQLVSTVILILYVIFSTGSVPATYFFIPVLFFFQIIAMIGVSYLLSSIGVYFRDLKDIVQVFCIAGVYIMPTFYLPSMVPALFKPILYCNPFSYMAWAYQDIFYFGRIDHPFALGIFIIGSTLIFYFGYRVFKKLKVMFGNVL